MVIFAYIDGKIKKLNEQTDTWDNSSRNFLEKNAVSAGIEFVSETSDEELVSMYTESVTSESDISEESLDTPSEFVAYIVAIDIHNGKYGQYRNQQQWAFDEVGFTDEQIEEALAIADTIN